MIKRLLIANRGEIACRIIHSARQMGILTVAVFSDPDIHAQHVLQADESFALGGKTASESYLNQEKIIKIAKDCDADAIHPGYGFLAEDANFSRAVQEAGLIFVGPSGDNIDLMGNKESAKACASEAGLPIAKDFRGDMTDKKQLEKAAKDIGFPLLVKASAGGGGKGMRLVHKGEELHESIDAAAREAEASFGNAAVFLEQYIRPARHIEVQVARDTHGNAIHLYTRECSIQRRHQKVIEEAPAHIPQAVQDAMCSASLNLANHIDYTGLGTLEFLLDQDNKFYFMEMNTRLQVEHPITEMVTGQDCVALQLKIAAGEKLAASQPDITCTGHAIEARICAESPLQDFMPSTGTLTVLETPLDARFDTGVIEGDEISPFYDSMIAKVVSYGEDRNEAIRLLHEALCETHIVGPNTNVAFVDAIIQSEPFKKEAICTEFIDKHFEELKESLTNLTEEDIQACTQAYLDYKAESQKPPCSDDYFSPWQARDNWRPTGSRATELTLEVNGTSHTIPLNPAHKAQGVDWSGSDESGNTLHVFLNGKEMRVSTGMHHGELSESANSDSVLSSPMPGTVTQVLVKEGDPVEAGQIVVCIEAMKMEHSIKAPGQATIKALHIAVGDTTHENQELLELDFFKTDRQESA